jgi:hypothetical protein
MWESTNGAYFCGINKKILKKNSNLEIMSFCFPKEKKHIWANFRKDGLVHLRYNIAYRIITTIYVFLISINNFEPNPILVNVNKLKPYTYVD